MGALKIQSSFKQNYRQKAAKLFHCRLHVPFIRAITLLYSCYGADVLFCGKFAYKGCKLFSIVVGGTCFAENYFTGLVNNYSRGQCARKET